jgi:hypothetical protein
MKVLWILGKVTAMALLMALGGTGAHAQAEIDPDHFDSPSQEPLHQPKTEQNQLSAPRQKPADRHWFRRRSFLKFAHDPTAVAECSRSARHSGKSGGELASLL